MRKVVLPALPPACLILAAVCREACSLEEAFQSQSHLGAEFKSTHTAGQAKVLAVKAASAQAKDTGLAAANLDAAIAGRWQSSTESLRRQNLGVSPGGEVCHAQA